MLIYCVAACINAGGEPDFFPRIVDCTQAEYDNGDHYDAVCDEAAGAGYEHAQVIYDENDGPAWLFDHFVWKTVPIVTVGDRG